MSKKYKYVFIALLFGAVLMFGLYFIVGGKKKEFTISFNSNGGTDVASQIVVEGNKVVKPADPTKENYNFYRWEYQNKEYDFNTKVTGEMTLEAIWEEAKVEEQFYDIEFIVNGQTKKLSLSKITEKDLEDLGFEQKDGYEIKWYVNDQEYDFSTPLTGNMSLVGKYVKVTLYTVKFNSDGGTSVTSQKIKPNEKVVEPEAITKYGFKFDGWYLNNTKYDFETPVTKNITLVAKWLEDESIKRYEVTFDSDGGSKTDKQRVIENEKATEPKVPTKEGYKFLGWYLNDTKYDFKTKVTKDITLKAKWEKIVQYTVTFDKNNGTTNETKTVNSGEKVVKPADPTKEGYTFDAWVYENKAFDFNTPITGDITLTATYTMLEKYTITFDSDGGTIVPNQTVTKGGKVTKPANPTKDDNDFVEWQLNGSKYDFNTTVTGPITLKAKWQAKVYAYKVVATKVDNYSPDSNLKIYRNGNEISFNNNIKIIDSKGRTKVLSSPLINTTTLEQSTVFVIDGGTDHQATVEFR